MHGTKAMLSRGTYRQPRHRFAFDDDERHISNRAIEVSVLISIYNSPANERAELLSWSLEYLASQSLPPNTWEVVIVDDMSDRSIVPAYSRFVGKMNIVHVTIDHRKHPIWREMNSESYISTELENWPHTPALSTNIAARYARGYVLCFSQPEMLVTPHALRRGYVQARNKRKFVFADIILTPPHFREQFLQDGTYVQFDKLWLEALGSLEGQDPEKYKLFGPDENYWMFAFLDRQWFFRVNGVDEEYLRGVYAEDDNFRDRLEILGIKPFRDHSIKAVHLNHEHETHKKQRRNSEPWLTWAKVNRERYRKFKQSPQLFGGYRANIGKDWGSESCVANVKRSYI